MDLARLYGESRNPGLLLLLIDQLFQQCHKDKLESRVTVKLSFASFQCGEFRDLLVTSKKPLKLSKDPYQKEYLVGQSQIIVRNVRTAVKMLKIASTNCLLQRSDEDIGSQSMIAQIKLEIESEPGSEKYTISKLKLFKFGDPSFNGQSRRMAETMKISQANRWAINLDNCLRECCMLSNNQTSNLFKQDALTAYLRGSIRGQAQITCLIGISNKLSANDCLNCLVFSYYISKIRSYAKPTILDVIQLKKQIKSLETAILPLFTDTFSSPSKLYRIQSLINLTMSSCFSLQCEYSRLLTQCCSSLNKYVLNEDVEEYFYCKKEACIATNDVGKLIEELNKNYQQLLELLDDIDVQKEHMKDLKRLYQLYKTAALHFFYQRNDFFKKGARKPTKLVSLTDTKSVHEANKAYQTQPILRQKRIRQFGATVKQEKPRKRVTGYEDYVKAMFFNSNMQSL